MPIPARKSRLDPLAPVVVISGAMLLAGPGLMLAAPPPVDDAAMTSVPGGDATSASPIYFPLSPRLDPAEPNRRYPDDLLRQFMDYHSAGRYELAAEMALRLVAAAPDQAISHYNLACVMARLRRTDEAIAALERAVDLGWQNLLHTTMDPDLIALRQDERYARLLATVRRTAEASRPRAGPLRTDPVELVVRDLETNAEDTMRAANVPGLAVAYVRDGQVAWTGQFGVADQRTRRPLEAEDRFELWSPSHLMALVAAAQQADGGHEQAVQLVNSVVELQELFDDSHLAGGRPRLAGRGDRSPGGASRLVLTAPAIGSGRASSQRADLVFELLCHELELASDEGFRSCCRNQILEPFAMTETGFIGDAACDDVPLVTGHSQFGTPVTPRVQRTVGRGMRTTAGDLGKIMAHLMQTREPVTRMSMAMAAASPYTGLAIRAVRTEFGLMVEMAEDHAGSGCLMRWYPDAGIGITILYNGQRGSEAARRMAHDALGGVG
jgi:CubicO group peptidase (beta-lactamase class C family)